MSSNDPSPNDLRDDIQRNLMELLSDNSSQALSYHEQLNQEEEDINQRQHISDDSSYSSYNSESDDCNSQCSTPCTKSNHISFMIMNEIKNNADSQQADLFTRLFSSHKKSKISMFVPKKEKKPEPTNFDVNRYFVPTNMIQLQNVSQFNLPTQKLESNELPTLCKCMYIETESQLNLLDDLICLQDTDIIGINV